MRKGTGVMETGSGQATPRFGVQGRYAGGVTELYAAGRLVAGGGAGDPVWQAARQWRGASRVVVDLAGVTAIDAGGLGALLRLRQSAGRDGVPVIVRQAGPRVRRVLQLVGLDGIFGLRGETAPTATGLVPSPPIPRREHHRATRRQAIAHLEAFGEAEGLQLAHLGLERQPLLPHQAAQVRGPQPRLIANPFERAPGPGATFGPGVEPQQPRPQILAGRVVERGLFAQRHAWIGAERPEIDAIHDPVGAALEIGDQQLARRVAGGVRIGVGDGVEGHRRDGANLELSDGGEQRAAGLHRRPAPRAVGASDGAVPYAVEHALGENHRAFFRAASSSASFRNLTTAVMSSSGTGCSRGNFSVALPERYPATAVWNAASPCGAG